MLAHLSVCPFVLPSGLYLQLSSSFCLSFFSLSIRQSLCNKRKKNDIFSFVLMKIGGGEISYLSPQWESNLSTKTQAQEFQSVSTRKNKISKTQSLTYLLLKNMLLYTWKILFKTLTRAMFHVNINFLCMNSSSYDSISSFSFVQIFLESARPFCQPQNFLVDPGQSNSPYLLLVAQGDWLNGTGGPLNDTEKPEVPCRGRCGTIKIPSLHPDYGDIPIWMQISKKINK